MHILVLLLLLAGVVFGSVELTQKEKEYLKNNPVIHVGYIDSMEPLLIKTSDQTYSGVVPDIMALISKKLHIQVKYSIDNWDKTLQNASQSKIDMIPLMNPQIASQYGLLNSGEVFTFIINVYLNKTNDISVNSIKDLYGKKVAYNSTIKIFEKFFKPHMKNIEFVKTKNNLDSLLLLENKKVDAVIGFHINNYLLAKYFLSDIYQAYTIDEFVMPAISAIAPNKPILQSIISKTIASFTNKEKDTIVQKWLGDHTFKSQGENRFQYNFQTDNNYTFIYLLLLALALFLGYLAYEQKKSNEVNYTIQRQVLIVTLLLIVILGYLISNIINEEKQSGHIINTSGKQRMFSQQIMLYAHKYNHNFDIETLNTYIKLINNMEHDRNILLKYAKTNEAHTLYYQDPDIHSLVMEYLNSHKEYIKNPTEEKLWQLFKMSKTLLPVLGGAVKYHENFASSQVDKIMVYIWIVLAMITIIALFEFLHIFNPLVQSLQIKNNEISKANKKYFTLLEYASDAVFILSEDDGRLIRHNKMVENLLGYNEEEMKDLSVLDWDREIKTKEQYQEIIKNVGFSPIVLNRIHTKKDGSTYLAEINAVRIKEDNEEFIYASVRDITEEHEKELNLLHEKEKLEKLTHNVPGVVYKFKLFTDGHTSFLYASNNIYNIYGVKAEEVKDDASKVFSVIHGDDLQRVSNSIEYSQRHLTTWINEYRVNHPIKGEIWVKGQANPERQEDGSTIWYGYIYDITDLKKAEQIIQNEQEKLLIAADSANMGIWELNLETYGLIWNDKMVEIYELDKNISENKYAIWRDCVNPNQIEEVERLVAHSIENHQRFDTEFEIITPSGKKHIKAYGIVRYDINNKAISMIGVNIDISNIKEKENQLLHHQKMASLGEMIGNIAHQWRQPLTVITLHATGLIYRQQVGELDEKSIIESAQKINDQSQYLSRTIDNFANFIKDTRDKKIMTFDLFDEFKDTINVVQDALKNNHIELITDCESIKDIQVTKARGELSQVLINIINNAKDAIKENRQEKGWIKLSASKKESSIFITIEDNGGGIPEEIIDNIFEPYFTTKYKSQGTGLGLNIAYRIINESLGGEISVQNAKEGARFIINLAV